MLSDEFPEWGNLSPLSIGGSATTVLIYFEDVDAVVTHPLRQIVMAEPGDVAVQSSLDEQLAELGPIRRDANVGHERELGRVIHLPDSVQANGWVNVLPTGLRLEFV
jgi:hypothetical protein